MMRRSRRNISSAHPSQDKAINNLLVDKKHANNLKMDDDDIDIISELSEYEKIRQINIMERQKMFKDLEIDLLKNENNTINEKRKPLKSVARKQNDENTEPVRKSLRIAGGVPEIQRFQPGDENTPEEELKSRPLRRIAPENCNDYLHVTKTFTGNETPDSLAKIGNERFKILKVPKKCTIKQFVLSNNLVFKVGRGFYEFTKPEIISHRKEVVLVDKESGEMFTGQDACRMIKAGSGIRIPPTTFNKWRVFVQSTSYGRILMGGTSFLYES